MKKILFAALTVFSVCLIHSCSSDPCDGVECVNGDCVDGTCVCENGFTGVNCDQVVDPCAGINCNNGNCNDGTCDCEPGFEGEFCDVETRAKFLGDWNGLFNKCFDEDTAFGNLADLLMVDIEEESTMTVVENPDSSDKINLLIDGFALGEDPLVAVVDGNTFTLEELVVDAMNFMVTVNGNGEWISDNSAFVTLDINIAGFIQIDCDVELTR